MTETPETKLSLEEMIALARKIDSWQITSNSSYNTVVIGQINNFSAMIAPRVKRCILFGQKIFEISVGKGITKGGYGNYSIGDYLSSEVTSDKRIAELYKSAEENNRRQWLKNYEIYKKKRSEELEEFRSLIREVRK